MGIGGGSRCGGSMPCPYGGRGGTTVRVTGGRFLPRGGTTFPSPTFATVCSRTSSEGVGSFLPSSCSSTATAITDAA